MKRVVAASLSVLLAGAAIAPGAAAQSSSEKPSSTTSARTGASSPGESATKSSTEKSSSAKTSTATTSATTSSPTTSSSKPSTARKPVRRDNLPIPVLDDGEFDVDYATQLSYVHIPTGFRADSENADEIRTCLSICKFYIAGHVYREGTDAQKDQATEMMQTSDDGITTRLYRAFPKSIREVAERYGLEDTIGAPTWGKSTTMHDMATFLAAKVEEGDFDDPVLAALADADTTTEIVEDIFTAAPRGEFVIEDGELVAKAAGARQAAVTSTDDSSASAGDWIAGVLLLGSAAGSSGPCAAAIADPMELSA